MKRSVLSVEINVYENWYPLVSGYLRSYAKTDPDVAAAYDFGVVCPERFEAVDVVLEDLIRQNADIYTLSCYVWNINFMAQLLSGLKSARPDAVIVLGGPQIMNRAKEFLKDDGRQVIICNGEGEITFSNILRALLSPEPDLSAVNGISFMREGSIVTTPSQPRIKSLDDIPSPYLAGEITGDFRMCAIETNRGCPFKCGFCYWGAANNDKVNKFSEDRVRSDLEAISQMHVPILYIADANWGQMKRDVDFSRHLVACKKGNHSPIGVIFNSAKNSPDRVSEITKVFNEEGLLSTQPISIQSMNTHTLKEVDRANISMDAYIQLQGDLNTRGIGSFIELIWPLPGESLETFKDGLEELSLRDAGLLVVYSHLLLRNTPLYQNREKYGFVTRRARDAAAEADIVIETRDASEADVETGFWHMYMTYALHNARVWQYLTRYLHLSGKMRQQVLIDNLTNYIRARPDHPLTKFCSDSIRDLEHMDFRNSPKLYLMILHSDRAGFTNLLREFAQTQSWWSDPEAQFLFEFEILIKPYLYCNSFPEQAEYDFKTFEMLESDIDFRDYRISVPSFGLPILQKLKVLPDQVSSRAGHVGLHIQHPNITATFSDQTNEQDRVDYISGKLSRHHEILAKITPTGDIATTGLLGRLFGRSV